MDEQELRRALRDSAELRILTILQLAMTAGVILFLLVVVVLHVAREAGPVDSTMARTAQILSVVHVATAVGCWGMAFFLYNALLRAGNRAAVDEPRDEHSDENTKTDSQARHSFLALRNATMVRLALLEAAAIFGLVVLLIAALCGVLGKQPLYWVNLVSPVFFIAFAFLTLPSEDRVIEKLRQVTHESHQEA